MKQVFFFVIAAFFSGIASAQNVGIGTITPGEKLEVNGNVKTDGIQLNSGGTKFDFLKKDDSTGRVGFRKGHGALGIHYIIATGGSFPSQTGGNNYDVTLIGEIKLFAGSYAPSGWAFCNGQLLSVNANQILFSLLGNSFGGNGQTNFAVPDLRGAVPVGPGTATAGYGWLQGEKSN